MPAEDAADHLPSTPTPPLWATYAVAMEWMTDEDLRAAWDEVAVLNRAGRPVVLEAYCLGQGLLTVHQYRQACDAVARTSGRRPAVQTGPRPPRSLGGEPPVPDVVDGPRGHASRGRAAQDPAVPAARADPAADVLGPDSRTLTAGPEDRPSAGVQPSSSGAARVVVPERPALAGLGFEIPAIDLRASATATGGAGSSTGRMAVVRAGSSGRRPQVTPPSSGRQRRASESARTRRMKYVISGEIARGGMGAVFEAFDADVRRSVALKALLTKDDGGHRASRFLEEIQLTGQLEHPNIVPVYDVGADASGRLYFTMKRVHGDSLSDVVRHLRRGRLYRGFTRNRLLEVFVKVCDAMAFAHSRGVIHRDLKPENIMVGDFGAVYVMDWGLGKIVGAPERHHTKLVVSDRHEDGVARTLDGQVVGTPAYMPPEQARGEIDKLDYRSDVYALGAVLYELLTHVPPVVGTQAYDIVKHVIAGDIRSPRQRAPQLSVPPELDAIVRRAMAPQKAKRFKTVVKLKEAVQAYIDGVPIPGIETTLFRRVCRSLSRNRSVFAGAAVMALLALGLLWTLLTAQARQQRQALAAARGDERVRAAQASAERRTKRREALTRAQSAWRAARRRFRRIALAPLQTRKPLPPIAGDADWFTDYSVKLRRDRERLRTTARLEAAIHALDTLAPGHPDAQAAWVELTRWREMVMRESPAALHGGATPDEEPISRLAARLHFRQASRAAQRPGSRAVALATDPPGATLTVFALRPGWTLHSDPRLLPVPVRRDGTSADELPCGIAFDAALRGRPPLVRPPPLGVAPQRISLPEGEYLIVASWARNGERPERRARARLSHPTERLDTITWRRHGRFSDPAGAWIPLPDCTDAAPSDAGDTAAHRPLAIGATEVTAGQYLAFLNDPKILARDRAARAAGGGGRVPRRAPGRTPGDPGGSGADTPAAWWPYDQEAHAYRLPAEWDPAWPVVGISASDAEAYAAWLTRTVGATTRARYELCDETHWRAAWDRATDGDAEYPWGAVYDPRYARLWPPPARSGTHPGLWPVAANVYDQTPLGVRNLGGLVAEILRAPPAPGAPPEPGAGGSEPVARYVVAGASWRTEMFAAAAHRRSARARPLAPDAVSDATGLRLLRRPTD